MHQCLRTHHPAPKHLSNCLMTQANTEYRNVLCKSLHQEEKYLPNWANKGGEHGDVLR